MKYLFIILTLLFSGIGRSQEQVSVINNISDNLFVPDHFQFFIFDPSNDRVKNKEINNEFNDLLSKVENKDFKNDLHQVQWIFDYVHRKYLKRYSENVSFSNTMINGYYDCLTGTAVFALILERLNIPYEILEYQYHITLLANLGDHEVLLESTDPYFGFVSMDSEIQSRLASFEETTTVYQTNGVEMILTDKRDAQVIDLANLAGLQYFNLAAKKFNSGDLVGAYELNRKARLLYPESDRIRNFQNVLLGLETPELVGLNND